MGICMPQSTNTPGACLFTPDGGITSITLQGTVSCFPSEDEDSVLGTGQVLLYTGANLTADSGISNVGGLWQYNFAPISQGTYNLATVFPRTFEDAGPGGMSVLSPPLVTYFPGVVITGQFAGTSFNLPTAVCPTLGAPLPQAKQVPGHLTVVGRAVDCQSMSYVSGAYLGLSTFANVQYQSGNMFSDTNPGTDASSEANFFAPDVPYGPFNFVIAGGSNDSTILFAGTFTPPPFNDAGAQIAVAISTPNGD